ncbi:hypothetical protein VPH35_113297 [Triticum aestivum]
MVCSMCRALLLLGLFLILTPLVCGYTDGGFSVELIHRDSPRSPFHDPSLTPHGRVLAAVRRSYAGSGSPDPDGAVSEVISGTFQFFMYHADGSLLRVGNSIIKLPNSKRSPVIVDSGSMLTSLDGELLDPIVEALARSIKLPRKQSPNPELFSVCYEADGMKALEKVFPDVTLELGGGALVTLKAENVFMDLLLQTVCLAIVPVKYEGSVPTIGSVMQHNMHVGYDLDKRTITFAPADCATSYPSPPTSLV